MGLEDVSKFPNLFAELIKRGYSDEDLQKIARLNLIRVFKGVEAVSMVKCSHMLATVIMNHLYIGKRLPQG